MLRVSLLGCVRQGFDALARFGDRRKNPKGLPVYISCRDQRFRSFEYAEKWTTAHSHVGYLILQDPLFL